MSHLSIGSDDCGTLCVLVLSYVELISIPKMTHIPSSMSQIMTFPHLFKHGYQRAQRKHFQQLMENKQTWKFN